LNVNDPNYIVKPKAVRDKFIYDPEHGGGRRRRNKHLPRQKQYSDNEDKIGYECGPCNFNDRLAFRSPCDSESPLKKVQPKLCQKVFMSSSNPFEVAKDVSPEKNPSSKMVDVENLEMTTPEGQKVTTSSKATHAAT